MSDKGKAKVHFVMTGGTIDAAWNSAQDTILIEEHSFLPEYFTKLKKNLVFKEELTFTEVCMKDSRALNEDDRKSVLKTLEESDAQKIIITHGIFTIPDTVRFLDKELKRRDQTIVLTGSIVPIRGFEFSDGPFNLGYAFSYVQTLEPGIYVCINARLFTKDDLAKHISEGKFYSVFTD